MGTGSPFSKCPATGTVVGANEAIPDEGSAKTLGTTAPPGMM